MDFKRNELKKYGTLISFIEKFYSLFPKALQEKMLIHYRKNTGIFGLIVRYALLRNLAAHVGKNVLIQPDVYFFNVDNLYVGDNVIIQPMCYIDAWGGVEIGNNVAISHSVSIISTKQSFDKLDIPIKNQERIAMPVNIGNDVCIGANASILGGSSIPDGTVIAANAVQGI